jgi:hypothetical protein
MLSAKHKRRRMPKLTEVEVLRRAKENCARDGVIWDADYVRPTGRFARIKTTLDQKGREEYLAQAKQQLIGERRKNA